MKRVQRRAHLVIWILLTPLLLWGVFFTIQAVTAS